MICYLFSEPTYFIFSSEVPALFYYAQIPATIIVLLVSLYAFLNGRQFLLNRLLFIISLLFSLWVTTNIITWTNIHSDVILFAWSFFGLISSLISIYCIYFIYVFLEKKDVSNKIKLIFITLVAPILFLSPTSFNLSGFNLTNCDAFEFEWSPFVIYFTLLGALAMVWIIVLLIKKYRVVVSDFKKQIIFIGIGIELFLFSFFTMVFLAAYLTKIGLLPDSGIELYGLFGMVIFMIYISILMVRFHAFNVKLIATQALVWSLVILIGSQFFFIETNINFILNGITFVGAIIFGQLLIKSIKKEIKQKEELASLNIDLQKLIAQKESLMHLINHKVKGAFTHSKYIFSEMIEGRFGPLTPELSNMASLGLESGEVGVETIDLILNASNLQKGLIQYEMKPVDFRNIVTDSILKKSGQAEQKNLKLEGKITDETCMVNGDAFWLKEVANNLIENSIRYTNKGTVDVILKKENGVVSFIVKDTGVGITEEDKKKLFTEGGRGKNSVKTNVDSTGYGLYTVKLIVEAHKGKVWVESEGQDKGSTFFVELSVI